jgi:3-deoxy-D-manno-octulosonic acid kinase
MNKNNVIGSYRYGTHLTLDPWAAEALFRLFEEAPGSSGGVLTGRAGPVLADIPGVGGVVVKHYRRGGMIRHVIKDRYLRAGSPRSRREYEMLETVRALGISSPEPLVWAIRGRLYYRAFLVTRRIEESRSLADIAAKDPALTRSAVEQAVGQIRLLIENGIYHVDLHPGNVLLDSNGKVYIIDFDKARRVSWPRERLCTAYIKRWKRAVEKYDLPADMTQTLMAGLVQKQRSETGSQRSE